MVPVTIKALVFTGLYACGKTPVEAHSDARLAHIHNQGHNAHWVAFYEKPNRRRLPRSPSLAATFGCHVGLIVQQMKTPVSLESTGAKGAESRRLVAKPVAAFRLLLLAECFMCRNALSRFSCTSFVHGSQRGRGRRVALIGVRLNSCCNRTKGIIVSSPRKPDATNSTLNVSMPE
jgi:hypothetical protein